MFGSLPYYGRGAFFLHFLIIHSMRIKKSRMSAYRVSFGTFLLNITESRLNRKLLVYGKS